MFTRRQNLQETARGGKPDRFVKQYEALHLLMGPNYAPGNPISAASAAPGSGQEVVNAWGVTIKWTEGRPGPFPVHDREHTVVKDIAKWKDVVKMPKTDYPPEAWEQYIKISEAVDRNEYFATATFFTGVFEQCHYLMG
jgi:hypothetical protein